MSMLCVDVYVYVYVCIYRYMEFERCLECQKDSVRVDHADRVEHDSCQMEMTFCLAFFCNNLDASVEWVINPKSQRHRNCLSPKMDMDQIE